MQTIHILISGLAAIILFVFGLENFSHEIEKISGERFRKSLSGLARIPIIGVAIDAVVTAIIRSSSAASVIISSQSKNDPLFSPFSCIRKTDCHQGLWARAF